jgi:amidohydrolase
MRSLLLAGAAALLCALPGFAGAQSSAVDARAQALEPKLLAWRRDLHQHPELGNAETRTAKVVADHLRNLGMEVHTGVAGTGVVGVLKGGKPGRTVALRADMDALRSRRRTPSLPLPRDRTYEGKTVPSCTPAATTPTSPC